MRRSTVLILPPLLVLHACPVFLAYFMPAQWCNIISYLKKAIPWLSLEVGDNVASLDHHETGIVPIWQHMGTMLCTREVLFKGMAQYRWPPSTNLLRTAPFLIDNIIYLCYKTSYLNEEVNCTDPSPSVSIPCMQALRTSPSDATTFHTSKKLHD